jgi:threonine aldolase
MEAGAHPFNYEGAAAAMISGVQIRPLPGQAGILNPTDVASSFRPPDPHFAPITLVCVEDTANRGGGTPYPISNLHEIGSIARNRGVSSHLDGARLFNAAVGTDIPADQRASHFDTVSVCLSKGLGAPIGSLLCGPSPLIEKARWIRKSLGGGMRQAGVIAAAGIYALEHHVERLADDHIRAKKLAEGLVNAGYTTNPPATNMIYVNVRNGPQAQDLLLESGIRCLAVSETCLRLVTHLDVNDQNIDTAIQVFTALADQMA